MNRSQVNPSFPVVPEGTTPPCFKCSTSTAGLTVSQSSSNEFPLEVYCRSCNCWTLFKLGEVDVDDRAYVIRFDRSKLPKTYLRPDGFETENPVRAVQHTKEVAKVVAAKLVEKRIVEAEVEVEVVMFDKENL